QICNNRGRKSSRAPFFRCGRILAQDIVNPLASSESAIAAAAATSYSTGGSMKRMHRKKLWLTISAMNAGIAVGLAPTAVNAQTPPGSPVVSDVAKAITPTSEKIEVTGSRLSQITTESVSPVNVISAQD